ncbi:MAG: hypothetical protein JO197_19365 [Acidobacteria bacterium]|nr:hypothetical protein [Acidobacteriota bacterium]MBV9477033.1 hypothetical protein [Acidobacteriota bacterium]
MVTLLPPPPFDPPLPEDEPEPLFLFAMTVSSLFPNAAAAILLAAAFFRRPTFR